MKLLYQTHSPFARKVLVFAHEAGLAGRIMVQHHETSPTNANAKVFAENPLGKVPVLLRPGAAPLFDSDVICAYLDTLHDRAPLIPAAGEARWRALRMQAVAQGIADAGVQLRWERVRRPEKLRYPPLADGYARKLAEGLAWLERAVTPDAAVGIGEIAAATAIDWIRFRDLASLDDLPALAEWLDDFGARPSMLATPLSGDTVD